MFKALVLLVVAVCVAHASVTVSPLHPKPEKYKHLEGCYIAELDQVIPFDESALSKSHCAKYYCTSGFVQYFSCEEKIELPSDCKLTFDDGLDDYPFCCGTIECVASSDTNCSEKRELPIICGSAELSCLRVLEMYRKNCFICYKLLDEH